VIINAFFFIVGYVGLKVREPIRKHWFISFTIKKTTELSRKRRRVWREAKWFLSSCFFPKKNWGGEKKSLAMNLSGIELTGIASQASESELLVLGIVLVASALLLVFLLKKLLENAVMGVIALLAVNLLGIKIGLNALTITVSAVLGLAGVGLLIILSLLGVRI